MRGALPIKSNAISLEEARAEAPVRKHGVLHFVMGMLCEKDTTFILSKTQMRLNAILIAGT
jgi:hypothetical protein